MEAPQQDLDILKDAICQVGGREGKREGGREGGRREGGYLSSSALVALSIYESLLTSV